MNIKLKAYFAHPHSKRDSGKKYRIKRALKESGVEVIDPFIDEFKMMREHGIKDYYDKPTYKLGREIWNKDLAQIRDCNMMVVWIPEVSMGTSAELQYGLEWQKRIRFQDKGKPAEEKRPFLIQMITKIKHPLIAYALQFGNQQYYSVKDFETKRQFKWES